MYKLTAGLITGADLLCQRIRGGKRPLWQARAYGVNVVGAGNSADNAIRDWFKQYKLYRLNQLRAAGYLDSEYNKRV